MTGRRSLSVQRTIDLARPLQSQIESDLYHARDHMSSAAIAEESENSDFDFIVDRVTEEVSRSLARQEKRNAPMHRQQLVYSNLRVRKQGLMRQHYMTGSSITYRSHVPLAVTIAAGE